MVTAVRQLYEKSPEDKPGNSCQLAAKQLSDYAEKKPANSHKTAAVQYPQL